MTKNKNTDNLFMAVQSLDHSHHLELYSTKHRITPNETVTSNSNSLFSLVAFSEQQKWKTGILQRCIDCLVFPEYRGNPEVYTAIDEEYCRLMRFKYETEIEDISDIPDRVLILFIRKIISLLGLKNSHDTNVFTSIYHRVPPFIYDPKYSPS